MSTSDKTKKLQLLGGFAKKTEVEKLSNAIIEKQSADFVVTVDANNASDKSWSDVFTAREEGRRVYLDRLDRRYEYIGEGHDYSEFERRSGTNIARAKLYDWHNTVEFDDYELAKAEDLKRKAGIENAVYVLKEGESLDDVPEGYALVYDPYAEEPEKDYYIKAEIDTMFGSYVNDIAELIGGEAIADS